MAVEIVLWKHSPFLQNVAAFSSVALLVLVLLIFRLLLTSNWEILTSRIFLEKERFRVFLKNILILTVLYAVNIGLADIIELLNLSGIYLLADAFTLLARISVLGSVYLMYSMMRELVGMKAAKPQTAA